LGATFPPNPERRLVLTVERLKEVIAAGRAVVIAGAGVSVSATHNAPTANWLGLVKHGAQFVLQNETGNEKWKSRVDRTIEDLEAEPDGNELLQLASQVASKIRNIGAQAFANWIEEAVGGLTIQDDSWPKAIVTLGLPVLTTNYDHILEKVSSHPATDWETPRELQELVARRRAAIGHLHGHYRNPKGIVLSEADYALQQKSDGVQAIERAVSATSSVIYIGCGGTLQDPNFSSLLSWHNRVFETSGVEHYRLCRDEEIDDLRSEHADSNITVLSYGPDFDSLPAFLESLLDESIVERGESGLIRDLAGEAREILLDELRQETIVGGRIPDIDHAGLHDIVIPPVLLPLPPEEFIRANQEKPGSVSRFDPFAEVNLDDKILLVADEASGLSTALRWLLIEGSTVRGVVPLALDFRAFPAGPRPLDKSLRKEARIRAVTANPTSSLPPHILRVDNYHGRGRPAQRAAAEIAETDGFMVVGCTRSQENDATAALRAAGAKFRVRYLGKLGTQEVRALARIAAGGEAEAVTKVVTKFLSVEHLPRTPFTVALLVEVMLQGEKLMTNISPTAILDQYVQHLLGRDDALQDSRIELSAADRDSILTDIAHGFLASDQGSLKQSECIARLEEFFERFAWDESPSDVLADLIRRRVLSFDGLHVRFTQSSFLHLFAAKSAAKDDATRELLLTRPIYYAAVLRAYAALSRKDGATLDKLTTLISTIPEVGRSSYENLPPIDAPDGLAERITELDSDDSPTPEIDAEESPDPFDNSSDSDVHPFPLTDDSDLTPTQRFTQALALVSVFLRDSEEIDDLELKLRSLRQVLNAWGYAGDLMSEDESYQAFANQMLEQLMEEAPDDAAVRGMLEMFVRIIPHVTTWAGIGSSLASRKLLVMARRLAADSDVTTNPRTALPLAMLLETTRGEGWESDSGKLVQPFATTQMVGEVLLGVFIMDFNTAADGSSSETKLRDIAADIYISRFNFKNRESRIATRNAFLKNLASGKMRAKRSIESDSNGEA
jgi:hypothetical protein